MRSVHTPRFRPAPALLPSLRFFGFSSPFGQSRRCSFLWCALHASTSLRPFTPPALPGFFATTDALTPADLTQPAGLPDSCPLPSSHSVPTHLMRPSVAFSRYPSADWASSCSRRVPTVSVPLWYSRSFHAVPVRSGLRHSLAGSPPHPAVSGSSSYGLAVHLPLLPTPPHGDAVTFGYRPESACRGGTPTPLTGVHSQAH